MIANLRTRFLRWARPRAPEPLPVVIDRHRIYVLPTATGLFFGLLLGTMMLGALNFNNNPALLLALLAAATTMISFHHNVAQLSGIELRAVGAEPVHAGQPIRLRLGFRTDGGAERPLLMLDQNAQRTRFSLPAEGVGEATMDVPTVRRGRMAVGRFRLWTEYPFGITWAWSVLHPDTSVLVYPAPERDAPPLPVGDPREQGSRLRFPGDDWHGLREHRVGDPPKHIAWKPSARQERLLVKEFADPQSAALLLDWQALALEREARISRLTRWVIDARDRQMPFRLRLPEVDLGPGQGPAFAAHCLRELALLP